MDKKQIIEQIKTNAANVYENLKPAELVEKSVACGEGKVTNTGALAADTGKFTGRSPKDKFTVADDLTNDTVWWGDINQKFNGEKFDQLVTKIVDHYKGKDIFIRDAIACADPRYSIKIKVVNESAYQNLFVHHMFIRPEESNTTDNPDWIILAAPSFMAVPDVDGTRSSNFSIIDFSKRIYIIGGSGYTGEIKKGIFTGLNFKQYT